MHGVPSEVSLEIAGTEPFCQARRMVRGLGNVFFWTNFQTENRKHATHCEGVGGVQGALTLFCGGVAQAFHDDLVVELKEQFAVEEVDGEGQEGKVKEEGRDRVKENAPWR